MGGCVIWMDRTWKGEVIGGRFLISHSNSYRTRQTVLEFVRIRSKHVIRWSRPIHFNDTTEQNTVEASPGPHFIYLFIYLQDFTSTYSTLTFLFESSKRGSIFAKYSLTRFYQISF
jgi:hypothetical protein